MSLDQYTKVQLREMSLIEIAYLQMKDHKEVLSFKELMDLLATSLGLSKTEVKNKISQFYTDLNVDGRFLCLGENRWGLRSWYPVDQVQEEIVTVIKPKKKKKKKEEDFDDYDELVEEEFSDEEDIEEVDEEADDEKEEFADFEEVADAEIDEELDGELVEELDEDEDFEADEEFAETEEE